MVAFEMNRNYIARNLCVNRFDAIPVCKGSCVLEKELNRNEKQQEKFPELKLKETSLFCQVNVGLQPVSTDILPADKATGFDYKTTIITSAYLLSVFRPPGQFV